MINYEEETLDFINGFKKSHPDEIMDLFINGYCYYFALILENRFKDGIIMYIPVYNHFCLKRFDTLYDITGIITDKEKISLAEPWCIYKEQDELETKRIIRDCILKISNNS